MSLELIPRPEPEGPDPRVGAFAQMISDGVSDSLLGKIATLLNGPQYPTFLNDLGSIVEKYINANDLCKKHRERLRLHVRKFVEWRSDRVPPGPESDAEVVSAWLAGMSEKLSPTTVNNHRGTIIALLRFATPDGVPLIRSDRIRRQKLGDSEKLAFTKDEIRRLIDAAPKYKPMTERTYGRGIAGDFVPRERLDGISWSLWWEAFVRVGFESGQYLADLRTIPWADVGADRVVSFVRHKTGKRNSFRLNKKALSAARRLGHPKLMMPWPFDTQAYFAREFKKFVATVPKVRVLGPKSIRRSALTYTYMSQGEEAARTLAGHSSFTITSKHYIDWTIARRAVVRPPSLK